jgi:pyridoxamine 5'-phosphate oxidase family protein
MSGMSFSELEIAYLGTQRLGRLATSRADGTLQVSPVGFQYNAALGTIDIGGFNMDRSWKYRNVAGNGRAAFVVDDIASVDPWRIRCLEIRGRAEAISAPADSAYDTTDPIIRISPERLISFGLESTDTDPHLLKPNARNV